jgi:hypothetical protein
MHRALKSIFQTEAADEILFAGLGIVPCGHAEVLVLGFHRVVGSDRQLSAREEDTSIYSKSLT